MSIVLNSWDHVENFRETFLTNSTLNLAIFLNSKNPHNNLAGVNKNSIINLASTNMSDINTQF